MALSKSIKVEPEIVNKTQCDHNYACLSKKTVCNAELYLDRDVLLLMCRDKRSCAFRKPYLGLSICTCPVNRASFRLN